VDKFWEVHIYASAYLVLSQSTSYPILLIAVALASIGFGIFHPISFCAVARGSKTSTSLVKEMGTFTAIGDTGKDKHCVSFFLSNSKSSSFSINYFTA
jgi:MFS transporter, FSR family, fosmidomycin resistance protein